MTCHLLNGSLAVTQCRLKLGQLETERANSREISNGVVRDIEMDT